MDEPTKRKRGPSRPAARLAMGANAVLSLAQAVDLLPLDRVKARQWLKDRQIVRTLAEHEVVIWGDVLDAMREAVPDPGARPAIPMADLSRPPRQARPG